MQPAETAARLQSLPHGDNVYITSPNSALAAFGYDEEDAYSSDDPVEASNHELESVMTHLGTSQNNNSASINLQASAAINSVSPPMSVSPKKEETIVSDTSSLPPTFQTLGEPVQLSSYSGSDMESTSSRASSMVTDDVPDIITEVHLDAMRLLGEMVRDPFRNQTEILKHPFPIFVFGTLRMHQCNNQFMGLPENDRCALYSKNHYSRDHKLQCNSFYRHSGSKTKFYYRLWQPAGLQHTYCDGLKLKSTFLDQASSLRSPTQASTDKVAPGEVYAYDATNFQTAIPGIDNLESFSVSAQYGGTQYVRTLMWVDLLPRSATGMLSMDLSSTNRTLERRAFEDASKTISLRMPVWTYSSVLCNASLARNTSPGSVLIWAPHPVPPSEYNSYSDTEYSNYDLLQRRPH